MALTPTGLSELKMLLDALDESGLTADEYIAQLEKIVANNQWNITQLRRLLESQEERTPSGRRRRKDRGAKRVRQQPDAATIQLIQSTAEA
jgi:hypothetical protein